VKCPFNVGRFVHKPYRPPERGYRVTPDQDYDYVSCYRVLVARGGGTTSRVLVDIRAPACHGARRHHADFAAVRFFSFGAEDDLDRYLFWLYEEALVDTFGIRPGLVVAEQWSFEAQTDIAVRPYRGIFIHPGRLDEWGLLTGARACKGDLALY